MADEKSSKKVNSSSNFFSSVVTFFTAAVNFVTAASPSDFHKAIKNESTAKVREMIDKGALVNFSYAGITPLYVSLSSRRKKYETTILLLERGADPNAHYEFELSSGKTLTTLVNWGDLSSIKLLAFYGANSTGVEFTKHPEYKVIVDLTFEKHLQRKNLEEQLNRPLKDEDRAKIFQQLNKLWNDLAQEEAQPVYKQHYLAKAEMYAPKAETAKALIEKEPHTPESEVATYNEESRLIKRSPYFSSSE